MCCTVTSIWAFNSHAYYSLSTRLLSIKILSIINKVAYLALVAAAATSVLFPMLSPLPLSSLNCESLLSSKKKGRNFYKNASRHWTFTNCIILIYRLCTPSYFIPVCFEVAAAFRLDFDSFPSMATLSSSMQLSYRTTPPGNLPRRRLAAASGRALRAGRGGGKTRRSRQIA